jgi:hypothetical protein
VSLSLSLLVETERQRERERERERIELQLIDRVDLELSETAGICGTGECDVQYSPQMIWAMKVRIMNIYENSLGWDWSGDIAPETCTRTDHAPCAKKGAILSQTTNMLTFRLRRTKKIEAKACSLFAN